MNYNEIYYRALLLSDIKQLKLTGAALAETIRLRIDYGRQVNEFEAFKQQVAGEDADDEVKRQVILKKATEEVNGFAPSSMSEATFEALCAAVGETVDSCITKESTDAVKWLEEVYKFMV